MSHLPGTRAPEDDAKLICNSLKHGDDLPREVSSAVQHDDEWVRTSPRQIGRDVEKSIAIGAKTKVIGAGASLPGLCRNARACREAPIGPSGSSIGSGVVRRYQESGTSPEKTAPCQFGSRGPALCRMLDHAPGHNASLPVCFASCWSGLWVLHCPQLHL